MWYRRPQDQKDSEGVNLDTNKSQLDKFREAARELETDDDEERFEEKLRGIVKQPPKQGNKKDE